MPRRLGDPAHGGPQCDVDGVVVDEGQNILVGLVAAGIKDLPGPASRQVEVQTELITIRQFEGRNGGRNLVGEIVGDSQVVGSIGGIIGIGGGYGEGLDGLADALTLNRRSNRLDPAIGIETGGEKGNAGRQPLVEGGGKGIFLLRAQFPGRFQRIDYVGGALIGCIGTESRPVERRGAGRSRAGRDRRGSCFPRHAGWPSNWCSSYRCSA